MTILYSLISRGKTVLAEFTVTSGNFPQITRVLLGKIQLDKDVKMSYVYDSHVFHYIVEDGIVYMCMCDDSGEGFKRRCPIRLSGGRERPLPGQLRRGGPDGDRVRDERRLRPHDARVADGVFQRALGRRPGAGQHQDRRREERHGAEHRGSPGARGEAGVARRQNRPAAVPGFYVQQVLEEAQDSHVLEKGQMLRRHLLGCGLRGLDYLHDGLWRTSVHKLPK
eukprot:CAMPEP_0181285816 /NCGR_PEP_ID=MMETSP1097-20121128/16224_1 /TAXON_ID=35684 /ORGANISM="Pseudopedinella elastica, Strain CCMP716" /LENGTH=223 /DNA_ID=CAMNT_0023389513 /DNA_START=27 /DNA_END=698 /DNA_ORIENTATION=-